MLVKKLQKWVKTLPSEVELAKRGPQSEPCGRRDRGRGPRTDTSVGRTSYSGQQSGQVDTLLGHPAISGDLLNSVIGKVFSE